MIKVLIADDEERICRLIRALADWESLGMEVVGMAHNGLEACEMAERIRPDILITDIRMPGYSGMELIERVKKEQPELEVVIISGYAHFEYAQQALQFGVGCYLLKPVSRAELNETLEKLRDKISRRRNLEEDKNELLRRAQRDDWHLRQTMLQNLIDGGAMPLSAAVLREVYHMNIKEGLFQCFCLKIDADGGSLTGEAADVMLRKAQELLERILHRKCFETVLLVRGYFCIGMLHYVEDRQEMMRRALKDCLSQMEMRRTLFCPAKFSIAVGTAYKEPEQLRESMREAKLLIQERLFRESGRLLEHLKEPTGLASSGILEQYLREITHAVEIRSVQELQTAVHRLQDAVQRLPDVRGYEFLDMIFGAADVFAVRMQMPHRSRQMEQFQQECRQYGSAKEVFDYLERFQTEAMQELVRQFEDDAVRPVRNAKQYIQKHFGEQITLEEVSSNVGLSTTYFSALFKKTEGEGFAKYLINVRMEQAKILLRETNLPVSEVCRRVGYHDSKHFTHLFEKATGVKPSTYRKLYG